jgi:hypothetical protein
MGHNSLRENNQQTTNQHLINVDIRDIRLLKILRIKPKRNTIHYNAESTLLMFVKFMKHISSLPLVHTNT